MPDSGRWSVADAVAFVEVSTEPLSVVYLAAQVALRASIGAKILEDHPALGRLRMVEAAPMGSQIVLAVDGIATHRPI